jgi:hypothetical protein
MVNTGSSEVIGSWNTIDLFRGFFQQIVVAKANVAALDAAWRIGHQADHRKRGHGLAAAGLSDERQRFAGSDGE